MKKIINENQWVKLPTEDKTKLHKDSRSHIDYIVYSTEDTVDASKVLIPQHLYLTSDEQPIEGDHVICYYDDSNEPILSILHTIFNDEEGVTFQTRKNNNPDGRFTLNNIKKIIATTDKSLTSIIIQGETDYFNGDDGKKLNTSKILPQIPEFFIKYYVEKQGKVGQTALQYFWINRKRNQLIEEREYKLKVSDENEIMPAIIETEDKIYNREEVIQKGRDLLGHLEIDESDAQEWFDTWVKEIK